MSLISDYFWNCDKCKYRNSRYVERCFSCNSVKPNQNVNDDSKSLFKPVLTRGNGANNLSTKVTSNSATRTKPYKPLFSPSASLSPTPLSLPSNTTNSSPSSSYGVGSSKTAKHQNDRKGAGGRFNASPTSSKTSFSTMTNSQSNQSQGDINYPNKPKPVFRIETNFKPRSLSQPSDQFSEYLAQSKLKSNRYNSANNVSQTSKGSERFQTEVLPALNKLTRECTLVGYNKSKSCLKLPSLNVVIKANQSSYLRKLERHRSKPFVDSEFTTNRSSLYRINEDSDPHYDRLFDRWLRVKDINLPTVSSNGSSRKNANHSSHLVVRNTSVNISDFKQGRLGNCWLITSLASLIWKHPNYLSQLIPDSKVRLNEGMYMVYLCLDGKWQPIFIDDYFPCDQSNQLVFTQAIGQQLFAPILEKALAKHHSCYKALVAGTTLEGFSYLTGMPCYRTPVDKKEVVQLWNEMVSNLKSESYIAAASCKVNRDGLHSGHAYSVLDIATVSIGSDSRRDMKTVLLWNPWGDQPLNGSFSQNDSYIAHKLGFKTQKGLFWMKYSDFVDCFSAIDFCKFNLKWHTKRFEFRLPFDANDCKNFTTFALEVRKTSHFEFTTYQKVHRDINFKYRLSLSLVVFKLWKDNSIQLVRCSPVLMESISNFSLLLGKGKYLILVIGFNHWGPTSRLKETPKLVLAIHCNKSFEVNSLGPDLHLLGDMLIQVALGMGERKLNKNYEANKFVEYLVNNFAAFIWMIENQESNRYLVVEFDTSQSVHSITTRTQQKTIDIIPPMCRQLVAVLARESDKDKCQHYYRYSIKAVDPTNKSYDMSLLKHHSDVETMSTLYAPRKITLNILAEKNRDVKIVFNEPLERKYACTVM